MLTKDQNELFSRVGPGTPMGELLRRYWHPIAGSSELAQKPVQEVRLLGETLVLFRDRGGRVGLVGSRCAHRGMQLRFGVVEPEGLRCPYHGWMFDTGGQCIQQPAEPPDSTFGERIKIAAYPVQEL